MRRFYSLKILKGIMIIQDVPKKWRNVTENWLLMN